MKNIVRNPQEIKIHVPLNGNKLLGEIIDRLNKNKEIYTLWKVINYNATQRLGMTDHGPVHFQIVANIALRLARILNEKGIRMSIVKDFDLSFEHAEVVIFLGSIMHDLGMSISREGHEEFSLILTNTLLRELLSFMPVEERTIVISETLHAIISHRKGGKPMTLEAGIVRVSDALDMSEGRSRIPYEAGKFDIHSISAAAIDNIKIEKGEDKLINIIVTMNNSAAVFQIDELLKSKLKGSGLEKYVSIKAQIKTKEKNLIREFIIDEY